MNALMAGPISPQTVLDIAGRLCALADTDTLRGVLLDGLRPFGFVGFTFAAVRRVNSVYLHAEITSTWPRPLQDAFQQNEIFNLDPVSIRSRTNRDPFVWDLSVYDESDPRHQQLLELRRAAGVTGGVCVPIAEAFQGRSVLFLSGRDFPTCGQTVLGLQLLAEHFAARVYALGWMEKRRGLQASTKAFTGDLTPRERQICGWLAFGKSSKNSL